MAYEVDRAIMGAVLKKKHRFSREGKRKTFAQTQGFKRPNQPN